MHRDALYAVAVVREDADNGAIISAESSDKNPSTSGSKSAIVVNRATAKSVPRNIASKSPSGAEILSEDEVARLLAECDFRNVDFSVIIRTIRSCGFEGNIRILLEKKVSTRNSPYVPRPVFQKIDYFQWKTYYDEFVSTDGLPIVTNKMCHALRYYLAVSILRYKKSKHESGHSFLTQLARHFGLDRKMIERGVKNQDPAPGSKGLLSPGEDTKNANRMTVFYNYSSDKDILDYARFV